MVVEVHIRMEGFEFPNDVGETPELCVVELDAGEFAIQIQRRLLERLHEFGLLLRRGGIDDRAGALLAKLILTGHLTSRLTPLYKEQMLHNVDLSIPQVPAAAIGVVARLERAHRAKPPKRRQHVVWCDETLVVEGDQ